MVILAVVNLTGCREENRCGSMCESTQDGAEISSAVSEPTGFIDRIVDFGRVNPASSYTAILEFYNDTPADITIVRAVPECTCSIAIDGSTHLAPGETTALAVTYVAGKDRGPVRQTFKLLYRDTAQRELTVTLKADIDPFVAAEPETITFVQRELQPQWITLYSVDHTEFSIQDVQADMLAAKFEQGTKSTRHVVELSASARTLDVKPYGVIRMNLEHPRCNFVEIAYDTLTDYAISDKGFRLVDMRPGQVIEKTVTIKSNFDSQFSIGKSYSDNGFMKVADITDTGKEYAVVLQITAPPRIPGRQRLFTDILTIEIEDGRQEPSQVKVGIRGYYERTH